MVPSPIPLLFGISKDLISMEIFPKVSLVTRLSFRWLRLCSHFLIYNFYLGGYKSGTVHEVAFKIVSIIGYLQTVFGQASPGKDKRAKASYCKMPQVWCALGEGCGPHNDKVRFKMGEAISSFILFLKMCFYQVLCEIWTPVFGFFPSFPRAPGCFIHHGE